MNERDKNLIAALRAAHSRSRRALFDAAANRLEELAKENDHLREATKMVLRNGGANESPCSL